jgi:hypothetical protein
MTVTDPQQSFPLVEIGCRANHRQPSYYNNLNPAFSSPELTISAEVNSSLNVVLLIFAAPLIGFIVSISSKIPLICYFAIFFSRYPLAQIKV